MAYPKITVITPSYNQAQFLEETILSVITQNYPNLEYIVIDGGSNDGSVDIIRKYEKYLTYWVSEPDKGHGNALNKGFARSTGEIMAWINSDDKYMPYTFNTVAEIFSTFKDVNWIQGKNSLIDKYGRLKDVKYSFINIYNYLLYDYSWLQQESVFWRRGLWEKSGAYINEDLQLMVDGELWSRFFLVDDLWHIDLVIGGFRSHDTNRSKSQNEQVHSEMRNIINKLHSKLNPLQTQAFISLQQYLKENILSSQRYQEVNNKRLYKILPYFLYKRITGHLWSKSKRIHLINREQYDYKVLESVDDIWVKGVKRFEYHQL